MLLGNQLAKLHDTLSECSQTPGRMSSAPWPARVHDNAVALMGGFPFLKELEAEEGSKQ